MNLRQLKKQDKRAAALLIGVYAPHYKLINFSEGCDGRWSYWSCDHWGEWDERPARSVWRDNEHPYIAAWMGYDPDDGEPIPPEKQPRTMRLHESRKWYALKPPAGWRWRGRSVVPVDKTGAMVRQKVKS